MMWCMYRFVFALLASFSLWSAEDISGYWKTISDVDGRAQSIIAVYPYQGRYYGRIIGSFNEEGKMDDSIYKPVKRAPGVVGTPFYSGMDIIWDLEDRGNRFKGKILDPEHGDIYNSELWVDNGNLMVRGKLFIFGRTQQWLPAEKGDFPKGFKVPDLKSFVPTIPQVN